VRATRAILTASARGVACKLWQRQPWYIKGPGVVSILSTGTLFSVNCESTRALVNRGCQD
jgi:hypothetical protein